jgi:hypothetical protein
MKPRAAGRGIGKKQRAEPSLARAAGASVEFAAWSQADERVEERLLELACECVDAADGQLALSMLGSAVQTRAPYDFRPELHGKVTSISKYMKARFGGWEAFIQAHADDGALSLAAGSVRRAQAADDDMPAEQDAGAQLRRAEPVGRDSMQAALDSMHQLTAGAADSEGA